MCQHIFRFRNGNLYFLKTKNFTRAFSFFFLSFSSSHFFRSISLSFCFSANISSLCCSFRNASSSGVNLGSTTGAGLGFLAAANIYIVYI